MPAPVVHAVVRGPRFCGGRFVLATVTVTAPCLRDSQRRPYASGTDGPFEKQQQQQQEEGEERRSCSYGVVWAEEVEEVDTRSVPAAVLQIIQ